MQTKIDFSLTGRELAARKPLQISADSAANIVGQLPSLGIHGVEKLSMDNALTGPPRPLGCDRLAVPASMAPRHRSPDDHRARH